MSSNNNYPQNNNPLNNRNKNNFAFSVSPDISERLSSEDLGSNEEFVMKNFPSGEKLDFVDKATLFANLGSLKNNIQGHHLL